MINSSYTVLNKLQLPLMTYIFLQIPILGLFCSHLYLLQLDKLVIALHFAMQWCQITVNECDPPNYTYMSVYIREFFQSISLAFLRNSAISQQLAIKNNLVCILLSMQQQLRPNKVKKCVSGPPAGHFFLSHFLFFK